MLEISRRIIRCLLPAVPLLVSAWPVYAAQEVFEHSYRLQNGGTFELFNVNGSVEVSGWEKPQIEIRAVKSALPGQDPAALKQVGIEVNARAGLVSVNTRFPGSEGVRVNVDYYVHVPHRVLLRKVQTVNGSIHVAGVDARGEVRTVNGNVEVLDSAGRIAARTTNGNVRLELHRLDRGPVMSVATMNGSVILALPSDTSANLDVRSFNGDFHSDLPVVVQGDYGLRRFRARLGAGGSLISMQTINGGIRVLVVRGAV